MSGTQIPDGGGTSKSTNPTVIGLFGVSGSIKTNLLNGLKADLIEDKFYFYDGPAMLDKVVPGGLVGFEAMDVLEKQKARRQTIEAISKQCSDRGAVGIVAGDLMLCDSADQESLKPSYTDLYLKTYAHMTGGGGEEWYDLAFGKKRATLTEGQLKYWQREEKHTLRELCLQHKICFMNLAVRETDVPALHGVRPKVSTLIHKFSSESETRSLSMVEPFLDLVLDRSDSKITLVFDGDKTLTEQDMGDKVSEALQTMGYTYSAFRQAMLMYEEIDAQHYESLCDNVASSVVMYPDILSLLQTVSEHSNITAVVVTSGLKRVWQKVLGLERLPVKVIGGDRLSYSFVVTPEAKSALVKRLQDVHKQYVWALGDSPLDLGMLKQADRAVVVVGNMDTRSKSMESHIFTAIDRVSKLTKYDFPALCHLEWTRIRATIRILIVAGVMREEFTVNKKLASYFNTSLVALRVAESKNREAGGTETRDLNQLFNATRLD